MDEVFLSLSHFIHLIATVIWIGGLLIFTLIVWPLARITLDSDAQRKFVLAFNKRYRPLANLSLVLLLGTGMIQVGADEHYEGLFTFSNSWTIAMLFKHLAFGGMVLLAGIIQFAVVPSLDHALLLAQKDEGVALQAAIQRETHLLRFMLGLGLVVLICTAIATAV